MKDEIPLFEIAWGGDDVRNVVDSITRGSHWAKGPYIERFEDQIGGYLERDHAIVFNSGTTALASVLEAHGIGPGDEVIVPSFTFVATANAVKLVDAEPVFADIERERYGLDPESVSETITDDTAAILPVHFGGCPCNIGELCEIAADYDLRLIEDAAEAFGARYEGRPIGSFGDSAMLSFCQNKIITTGEGGAVVTDDEALATRLRLLRSHGRETGNYFESSAGGNYVRLGSNFRMPDVNASIGVAQMEKVEELIERRQAIARRFSNAFEEIDGIVPPEDPTDGDHVFQLYTVTFEPGVDREVIIDILGDHGIASKVYFDPVHLTTYYRNEYGYEPESLPVTEDVSSRVLSLPIHPNQPIEATERIVESVKVALQSQE